MLSKSKQSAEQIEGAVDSAVQDYVAWQCGKLGRDINPDELRKRVKETGVKRIEMNEPVFTILRDGLDLIDTVPQIATIGSISIINGGYEDE